MTVNIESGYRQMHVRLPRWLMDRITAHAEAIGQTPSAETRRALVLVYGEKMSRFTSNKNNESQNCVVKQ